jgi:ribosomal-protein-alanine N-acetyltransferase
MLLQRVRDLALERGLSSLWLEVRQSNQRARRLYLQLGFNEAGVRKGYYPAAGGREDAVVMALLLQPEAGAGLDARPRASLARQRPEPR